MPLLQSIRMPALPPPPPLTPPPPCILPPLHPSLPQNIQMPAAITSIASEVAAAVQRVDALGGSASSSEARYHPPAPFPCPPVNEGGLTPHCLTS